MTDYKQVYTQRKNEVTAFLAQSIQEVRALGRSDEAQSLQVLMDNVEKDVFSIVVLGAISAYEREINAERREYGYKKALDEKRVGRPKAVANQAFHDAVKLWKDGKITATEAIKQAGMTRTTFYKLVKAERGQA